MEQQIDPNIKPDFAVSTDPAFLPGLVGARPAPTAVGGTREREDGGPEDAAGEDAPQAVSDDEAEDAIEDAPGPAAGDETAADDTAGDDTAGDDTAADGEDADADGDGGPVFEVSDRRGSISANREGVRFRLDDQEADFRWDEIGAVEVKTPRFGRRFTVTVHIAANRWFNAEVEADARSRLKEWTAELDAVLDAYFEES
ncbi:hypothetical protein HW130_26545 [Streptomyces sp. PKU-EA00015]|uniref:hypothetical protein n=1 Tax=Streptomyces sp. PKU-EA00015 TaxID=2748326 RepID=UPI0015A0D51C|nr:hypothetical protein [Streptomyces sp. PKU-EA00015]NWF29774.1 hypothetical protein [Streptomyces sp. PKU-EA00015]